MPTFVGLLSSWMILNESGCIKLAQLYICGENVCLVGKGSAPWPSELKVSEIPTEQRCWHRHSSYTILSIFYKRKLRQKLLIVKSLFPP